MASTPQPLYICSWKRNHWGLSALQLTGPCSAPRESTWSLTEKYPGRCDNRRGRRHCADIPFSSQILSHMSGATWENPKANCCRAFMFRHGQPPAHSSDSPQWIAPCASAFSLEGEEAKRASCPVSHLPAKREVDGTKDPRFLHWKSPV